LATVSASRCQASRAALHATQARQTQMHRFHLQPARYLSDLEARWIQAPPLLDATITTAGKKRLIEAAYTAAEAAGLAVWCQDEAGPYQAIPQPGATWHPAGHPTLQPHEYVRGGTAKLLTLFRPATGEVRAQGVLSAPNAVLHPWLKDQLSQA